MRLPGPCAVLCNSSIPFLSATRPFACVGGRAASATDKDPEQDVLIALGPLLRKLCRRIQVDIERIKTAGGLGAMGSANTPGRAL